MARRIFRKARPGQVVKNRKKSKTDFPPVNEKRGDAPRRQVNIRRETFDRLMKGAEYGDSVDIVVNRILDARDKKK